MLCGVFRLFVFIFLLFSLGFPCCTLLTCPLHTCPEAAETGNPELLEKGGKIPTCHLLSWFLERGYWMTLMLCVNGWLGLGFEMLFESWTRQRSPNVLQTHTHRHPVPLVPSTEATGPQSPVSQTLSWSIWQLVAAFRNKIPPVTSKADTKNRLLGQQAPKEKAKSALCAPDSSAELPRGLTVQLMRNSPATPM